MFTVQPGRDPLEPRIQCHGMPVQLSPSNKQRRRYPNESALAGRVVSNDTSLDVLYDTDLPGTLVAENWKTMTLQ